MSTAIGCCFFLAVDMNLESKRPPSVYPEVAAIVASAACPHTYGSTKLFTTRIIN